MEGNINFGSAFLDRSSGPHGSEGRGGCGIPGGVGGVDPGFPAPPPDGCGGVPPALNCLLLGLLLMEGVLLLLILLLLIMLLLLVMMHLDSHLDCCFDHCYRFLESEGRLVGLLLLLSLAVYARMSIALDTRLHLELHWRVELEVVVVAVAALEELYCDLSGPLEIAAVLELLFPMELLLEHILHFVCMP